MLAIQGGFSFLDLFAQITKNYHMSCYSCGYVWIADEITRCVNCNCGNLSIIPVNYNEKDLKELVEK